jgi:hypothetical protein
MDWPYLHTLINHFPIILSVVGTVVLLAALVSGRRNVWLYALVTLTFAGLSVYPAYLSGHEAEGVMKQRWYVVRSMIHAHEESAEIALWVVLITGAISAYTWWRMARREPDSLPAPWLRLLVVIGALGSTGALTYSAYQGGLIVHASPRLENPPASVP